MAVTTGFIQKVSWWSGGPTACVWVGPDPALTTLFFIQIRAGDTDFDITAKKSILNTLVSAQLTGREVDINHGAASSEIESVNTTTCSVAANDVQMDTIEVTQAVQDLSLAIPLVADKRTVVRVYLSAYTAGPVTLQGNLDIRRGPADPPLVVPSLNTVTLLPADAGNVAVLRADIARTLNFEIPASHVLAGPLAIQLGVVTNIGTGAAVAVGCARRPTVWFHDSPALRVRIIGLSYTAGMPPVVYAPTGFDFQALISWLGRAYPAGQVVSSQTTVVANAAPPFGCGDANAQIAAMRALDMAAGGDARTHYYALVSDGTFFMRGCAAGIPATPDPGTVASGPTGAATWGWDNDGSYGDWYGGHELGHTYGRLHPGFCGETADDLANYPFTAGQLTDADVGFAGFDVGDVALGIPMAALRGTQWHDVMTYCSFQWLGPYTYLGIRRRLREENV